MSEVARQDEVASDEVIFDLPPDRPQHTVSLTGRIRTGVEPPKATCTCGWEFGPSERMLDLGVESLKHSRDTGHKLRQHTFGMSD